MTRCLILTLAILACGHISARSQSPDASRLWIFVEAHTGISSTISAMFDYGNAPGATYYLDNGDNGTINYHEWLQPPNVCAEIVWKGIPGRNNLPIIDGLAPRDYRPIPANQALKDTFKIQFEDCEIPDSSFYFSWPDSVYLHARCDSMFIEYHDSTNGTQKIDMFSQTSLQIPAAGRRGISSVYIYKYGVFIVDGVNDASSGKPHEYSLAQAFPNPFNSQTTIRYSVASRSQVTMKVFDVDGRVIATLVNEDKSAGDYSVQWDANTIASGVYFYRIQAGNFTETKKIIVMK